MTTGFITTSVHQVHSIHPGDAMGCGAGLPLRMKEQHPPASVLAQLSGCSGIKGVVYYNQLTDWFTDFSLRC